ncbi:hypothetical protein SAMN06269185_1992 [Natronoarchaeum philippinense]|uniref:Uncharacterized protein n=1 Tax=Natronoarchaeum philippinense TaxID=558529 RepID=A0A285NU41_NATPI|nr:DUF5791 family protein [Natronoarchaeum philippinense]SNZ12949.1 hypothetical protein SAMN06269185_1992 [Natronoarchaeum philippinense]
MLHEQRFDTDGLSPADLRSEYDDALRAAVEDGGGVDTVIAETGVDRDAVTALTAGESPDISVGDAAALQALDADAPDAETIVEMAWEHLLLGMSSAVLDVETLANEIDDDLSAKEVQQKLERRAPATLDEFVAIEHAIVDRQR